MKPLEDTPTRDIPLKCLPSPDSLNHGRVNIFMPQKCAQSIPRFLKYQLLCLGLLARLIPAFEDSLAFRAPICNQAT